MEADVGVHQGLLCCCDAIDGQRSLDRRAALDQAQRYGAEFEVAGRAAYETHCAPIDQQLTPRNRQRIDAAVQVQLYQSPRRPSEVVDSRNRLLASVAAFVQVDGDAEEPDLIRDSAVIGVEADPGYAGSDPASLECPGASSRKTAHHVLKPITRHEQLAAAKRVGAYADKVVAGDLSSGPHDRVFIAPVGYLNSHQETHAVEPGHQCWR